MNMNQLFDQFIGGQSGNTTSGPNTARGISDTLANAMPTGLANKLPGGITGGVAGGLAAGGLLGLVIGNKKVRKKAGKLAGGAVGLGGAAALGALAFSAYQKWQGGNAQVAPQSQPGGNTPHPNPAALPNGQVGSRGENHVDFADGKGPASQMQPSPTPESFNPDTATATDGQPFQLALLKAMIAAANADGHIDSVEQKNIFDAVDKVQLGAEEKAFIFDTLRNPPSIEMIASLANGLEQASEIYLVSVLAIDVDEPSEQAYLDTLAEHLSLPPGFTAHLEHQVAQTNRDAA